MKPDKQITQLADHILRDWIACINAGIITREEWDTYLAKELITIKEHKAVSLHKKE